MLLSHGHLILINHLGAFECSAKFTVYLYKCFKYFLERLCINCKFCGIFSEFVKTRYNFNIFVCKIVHLSAFLKQ